MKATFSIDYEPPLLFVLTTFYDTSFPSFSSFEIPVEAMRVCDHKNSKSLDHGTLQNNAICALKQTLRHAMRCAGSSTPNTSLLSPVAGARSRRIHKDRQIKYAKAQSNHIRIRMNIWLWLPRRRYFIKYDSIFNYPWAGIENNSKTK